MTSTPKLPIVLDTSTLSNFAWIKRLDILEFYCRGQAVLLPDVERELAYVPQLLRRVSVCIGKWLQHDALDLLGWEGQEYARLTRHVGQGEAAVMAYARSRGGTVASDNIRDVRRYCEKHKVPLVGTPGIMYAAFAAKVITQAEAERAWGLLVGKYRYKAPVATFSQVRDYFGKGRGTKLF